MQNATNWLRLLFHAYTCAPQQPFSFGSPVSCQLAECGRARPLLAHILTCDNPSHCQQCALLRRLLLHFILCEDPACQACNQVSADLNPSEMATNGGACDEMQSAEDTTPSSASVSGSATTATTLNTAGGGAGNTVADISADSAASLYVPQGQPGGGRDDAVAGRSASSLMHQVDHAAAIASGAASTAAGGGYGGYHDDGGLGGQQQPPAVAAGASQQELEEHWRALAVRRMIWLLHHGLRRASAVPGAAPGYTAAAAASVGAVPGGQLWHHILTCPATATGVLRPVDTRDEEPMAPVCALGAPCLLAKRLLYHRVTCIMPRCPVCDPVCQHFRRPVQLQRPQQQDVGAGGTGGGMAVERRESPVADLDEAALDEKDLAALLEGLMGLYI